MNEEMIKDLSKLIRNLRNEANLQRWGNTASTQADTLDETALAIEKILTKYEIKVQLQPGDARGYGWRTSPWIGFSLGPSHLG